MIGFQGFAQIAHLKSEKDLLERTITVLDDEKNDLEQDLSVALKQKSDLEDKLKERLAPEEVNDLRASMATRQEEIKEAECQLASLQSERLDTLQKLQKMKDEKGDIDIRLQDLNSLSERLGSELQSANIEAAKVPGLEERVEALSNLHEDVKNQLGLALTEANKVPELRKEVHELTLSNQQVNDKLVSAQAEANRVLELEEQLKDLRNDLVGEQAEASKVPELEQRVRDLLKAEPNSSSLQEELSAERTKLKSLQYDHERELEKQWSEAAAALQAQIATLSDTHTREMKAVNEARYITEDQLTKAQNRINQLTESLKDLEIARASLETEKSSVQLEVTTVQDERNVLKVSFDFLRGRRKVIAYTYGYVQNAHTGCRPQAEFDELDRLATEAVQQRVNEINSILEQELAGRPTLDEVRQLNDEITKLKTNTFQPPPPPPRPFQPPPLPPQPFQPLPPPPRPFQPPPPPPQPFQLPQTSGFASGGPDFEAPADGESSMSSFLPGPRRTLRGAPVSRELARTYELEGNHKKASTYKYKLGNKIVTPDKPWSNAMPSRYTKAGKEARAQRRWYDLESEEDEANGDGTYAWTDEAMDADDEGENDNEDEDAGQKESDDHVVLRQWKQKGRKKDYSRTEQNNNKNLLVRTLILVCLGSRCLFEAFCCESVTPERLALFRANPGLNGPMLCNSFLDTDETLATTADLLDKSPWNQTLFYKLADELVAIAKACADARFGDLKETGEYASAGRCIQRQVRVLILLHKIN
ncbi:hypothetical protein D9758_017910 [Tetrapyrgos nigripes]|uniref:Uncharacterized protein n=1 Tax=Tetrapyrgos nigripes TaxID=182062 RepID=A0A8H5FEE8_9AGAR|nr:hypothetical protein D9758_017910 [Tetrapyrgos nigripes]